MSYCTAPFYSFITLKRWKWVLESINAIEEKGSSHNLGTLERKIRMDVIRCDKYNNVKPQLNLLVGVSQSNESYKTLKIKSKVTYNWEF